jgi:signal peptide peptidase SppA
MADPDVKGIALHCSTPGGEVAGCFELVDRMFAMRGTKPIRGFAHEHAYSAGYAVISVADPGQIYVSQTGGVGSIGVVTSHVDYSKMLENDGVKVTFIHFGAHKVDGNPFEALSPAVKARIQSRINASGEVFVSKMARNRGMSEKAIRDTEALTYTAAEAIQVGLADAVGPLDEAMTAFVADISTEKGEDEMYDKTNATVTAADHAAAVEAARAEGLAAGKTEGQTAERARITAIIGSEEGKKRPKAALAFAMKSGMDEATASALLADLAEETASVPTKTDDKADDKGGKDDNATGQKFDEAMSNGKPKVGANDGEKDDEDDKDSAKGILEFAHAAGIPGMRKRDK